MNKSKAKTSSKIVLIKYKREIMICDILAYHVILAIKTEYCNKGTSAQIKRADLFIYLLGNTHNNFELTSICLWDRM